MNYTGANKPVCEPVNAATEQVVLGVDLGTQGVRIIAVTPQGEVAAAVQATLSPASPELPEGWFEQSPLEWWQIVCSNLRKLISQLPPEVSVAGICVVSTSGTILPVGQGGEPLYRAIMYNDRRSEPQVPLVLQAGASHQSRHGYVFGSSYALPKIVWFKQQQPTVFDRTWRFLHAADYIAGKLSGSYEYSDTSNVLKMGYDLIDLSWPEFIEKDLGISIERLPKVVLPGTIIGQVSSSASQETGLASGVPVVAGATDGTAAQVASGASMPGDWNSTLGTTLVLKGISLRLMIDPLGRVYSHRHPEGWWMPGGASNTGAEWIPKENPGADPAELDNLAADFVPTKLVRYPLVKNGERFPFISKNAAGFTLGKTSDSQEYYAAGLEGLALLERQAYTMLMQLGLGIGSRIYITGGGSRSQLWSRIRASVLGCVLIRPQVTETAMGAAMLAASGCWYSSLQSAAAEMVRISQTFEPVPAWQPVYEERFQVFQAELARRGYLD